MKFFRAPLAGKADVRVTGWHLDPAQPMQRRTTHGSGCKEDAGTRDSDRLAIAVPATMNFHLFDLAGFIGVLLIVVAYLLLQLDKLPSSSPRYSLLNAGGALLIIVSLIFAFNLSAFIVEVFWFLISLLGLWRSLIPRKNSRRSSGINGNDHH